MGHQIIHTIRRVTTTRVGTDADIEHHPHPACGKTAVVVAGTPICPTTTARYHSAIRTAIARLCPGQSAGSPRDTNTSPRGFLLQSHSDRSHSIVIRPWITPLRYLRLGVEDADGADGDGLDAGDVGDGEDLEEEDGRPSRLVLRSCHRHRHPSREDFGWETCKEIGYRSMNCVSTWPLSRVPYVPIWMFWLTNTRHRGNYATVSAAGSCGCIAHSSVLVVVSFFFIGMTLTDESSLRDARDRPVDIGLVVEMDFFLVDLLMDRFRIMCFGEKYCTLIGRIILSNS